MDLKRLEVTVMRIIAVLAIWTSAAYLAISGKVGAGFDLYILFVGAAVATAALWWFIDVDDDEPDPEVAVEPAQAKTEIDCEIHFPVQFWTGGSGFENKTLVTVIGFPFIPYKNTLLTLKFTDRESITIEIDRIEWAEDDKDGKWILYCQGDWSQYRVKEEFSQIEAEVIENGWEWLEENA